jgi:hypothetical protein
VVAPASSASVPCLCHARGMEANQRVKRLRSAAEACAEGVGTAYDEVVEQVAARAQASGSLGKLDVGALAAWKRLRADTPWMSLLMATQESEVRLHSGRAVAAARDLSRSVPEAAAAARSALTPLPGFAHGDALASAVCFAAAPGRLAVYDKRAHRGLDILGLTLDRRPGRYGRYLSLIEQCRAELAAAGHDWSARQVDLALFWLGRA